MTTNEDIVKQLTRMEHEQHKIFRAVYGEEDNDVDGLIKTVKDNTDRIVKLEDTKKKALWFGGAILASIELGVHAFKEKFFG